MIKINKLKKVLQDERKIITKSQDFIFYIKYKKLYDIKTMTLRGEKNKNVTKTK